MYGLSGSQADPFIRPGLRVDFDKVWGSVSKTIERRHGLRVDSTEFWGLFCKTTRESTIRSWSRSDGWEIPMTWPCWLGLYCCKNSTEFWGRFCKTTRESTVWPVHEPDPTANKYQWCGHAGWASFVANRSWSRSDGREIPMTWPY